MRPASWPRPGSGPDDSGTESDRHLYVTTLLLWLGIGAFWLIMMFVVVPH